MSPAITVLYIVVLIIVAGLSARAALYVVNKVSLLAVTWDAPPYGAILASEPLPDRQAGFVQPALWASVVAALITTAIVLGYVSFVQSALAPLEDARNLVMTELPFCTQTPSKLVSRPSDSTCSEEVARITGYFAEGSTNLASHQSLLLVFAGATILALLVVPHVAYGLHRRWFHRAGHVLTHKAFIHQTQLSTMACLLICSFLAFIVTHYGKSLGEVGNGVADIGSNVISPLTFDSEQYLKTLTAYGPLAQRKMLIHDITQIRGSLHIIAAQSFIVCLVLFEIVKECFIKPVLKEGVSEFRHVPAPAQISLPTLTPAGEDPSTLTIAPSEPQRDGALDGEAGPASGGAQRESSQPNAELAPKDIPNDAAIDVVKELNGVKTPEQPRIPE